MSKERKCKKCGLTYKGFTTSCPYCHKRTKYGTLNNIMAVIGYLSSIGFVSTVLYFLLIGALASTFFFVPALIFIAVIVAIIVLILK